MHITYFHSTYQICISLIGCHLSSPQFFLLSITLSIRRNRSIILNLCLLIILSNIGRPSNLLQSCEIFSYFGLVNTDHYQQSRKVFLFQSPSVHSKKCDKLHGFQYYSILRILGRKHSKRAENKEQKSAQHKRWTEDLTQNITLLRPTLFSDMRFCRPLLFQIV